jgi:hypothetical protein
MKLLKFYKKGANCPAPMASCARQGSSHSKNAISAGTIVMGQAKGRGEGDKQMLPPAFE